MPGNTKGAEKLDGNLAVASSLPSEHYVLHLYITGSTPRSTLAIVNLRKLCEQHLEGRHELLVVDISLQPALAKGMQIIAAPTLIKTHPLPQRRFIGDMSRTESILNGLGMCEPVRMTSSGNAR